MSHRAPRDCMTVYEVPLYESSNRDVKNLIASVDSFFNQKFIRIYFVLEWKGVKQDGRILKACEKQ